MEDGTHFSPIGHEFLTDYLIKPYITNAMKRYDINRNALSQTNMEQYLTNDIGNEVHMTKMRPEDVEIIA